jgi:hypothetical protein
MSGPSHLHRARSSSGPAGPAKTLFTCTTPKRVQKDGGVKLTLGDKLAFGFQFDMGQASAKHFSNQGSRQGFIDGELNGALGDFVGLKLRSELFDDAGGGKKGAVVGESSKPDQNLLVFEGWEAIADEFGGSAGSGGANERAEFPECGALGLGDSREVGVDSGVRFRRFGSFHESHGSEGRSVGSRDCSEEEGRSFVTGLSRWCSARRALADSELMAGDSEGAVKQPELVRKLLKQDQRVLDATVYGELRAGAGRPGGLVEPAPRLGSVVEMLGLFLVVLFLFGLGGFGGGSRWTGRIVVTPPPGARRARQ